MDQSDIKYIIELLNDAKMNTDWEVVEDAILTLNEFLDDRIFPDDDQLKI